MALAARYSRGVTMTPKHPRRIESSDNAAYKEMVKLLSGRGIRKQEAALVSGSKIVADVLSTMPERCEAWIATARHAPPPPQLPAQAARYELSGALFRDIDVSGTDAPILRVRTPAIEAWDAAAGLPDGVSLLVPFQDPENVGAVIRSAVAFGVDRVILLEECAHPWHPKALRASAGAVLHATLRSGPPLPDLPPSLPVVALSPEGRNIAGVTFPDTFGLLPGIEGPGLPAAFRANAVSIPVSGGVESLNAATATAIVLYLWSRGR